MDIQFNIRFFPVTSSDVLGEMRLPVVAVRRTSMSRQPRWFDLSTSLVYSRRRSVHPDLTCHLLQHNQWMPARPVQTSEQLPPWVQIRHRERKKTSYTRADDILFGSVQSVSHTELSLPRLGKKTSARYGVVSQTHHAHPGTAPNSAPLHAGLALIEL